MSGEPRLVHMPPWPFIAAAIPLTGDEAAQLERCWREAYGKGGHPKLLTPLPRRVRLRLAVRRVLTGIGIWLVDHGHIEAARRLWTVTGLLGRKRKR